MLPARTRWRAALLSLLLFTTPLVGNATTLQEALIAAYQNNPSLVAARANLRSQDETVAQARAGLRPQLALSATGRSSIDVELPDFPSNSLTVSLTTSLMLYDGGRTQDAIDSATQAVYASQQNLESAEQSILLEAAIAYLDVRRDLQFLALANNNIRVIEQQVQATKDRFDVGAVTQTDVALAEARLAAAQTNLAATSGALALSREIYRAVVGFDPVNLQSPPRLPSIPGTLAEAESIAMREHPAIKAARFMEASAEYDLKRAQAARMPTISIGTSLDYTNSNSIFNDESTSAAVTLNGTLPLLSGGAMPSGVRAAEQILLARMATTQDTMRAIRQATAIAWTNIRVARASIAAAQAQIDANQVAFDGIMEETRLGSRTTLDLLDAEQELLTAKSNLATARRDEYVAVFNLLSAMGLLTVENLSLGIPSYDPNVNFNAVKTAPGPVFPGTSVLNGISDRWK